MEVMWSVCGVHVEFMWSVCGISGVYVELKWSNVESIWTLNGMWLSVKYRSSLSLSLSLVIDTGPGKPAGFTRV